MNRQKITILLMAAVCLSSMSGFTTVICCGVNGGVAIEPVAHGHCGCSHAADAEDTGAAMKASAGHDHCRDSLVMSGALRPDWKNGGSSQYKLTAFHCIQNQAASSISSAKDSYAACGIDFLSFHTPLRTIIILS